MIRMMLRRMSGRRWPKVAPGEQLSCPEVGRLLQRFLDGELEAEAEVQALAEHLGKCARCGREAEVYRRIKGSLERGRPPVDDETVARLRAFGERLTEG